MIKIQPRLRDENNIEPLDPQPKDDEIGHNCFMYAFQLNKSNFKDANNWLSMFEVQRIQNTFDTLLRKKCLYDFSETNAGDYNVVLYLDCNPDDGSEREIRTLSPLHAARIKESKFLSRMCPGKIYRHAIQSVFGSSVTPQFGTRDAQQYVCPIFCKVTEDMNLLLCTLRQLTIRSLSCCSVQC